MSLWSTEHLTSTFPVAKWTMGNIFFFLKKKKECCDRVCVYVRKCSTDGKSYNTRGLSAYLHPSSKMTQDNKVSEKYQIIVSVSNSLLPFTGLHSPWLPLVSSLTLGLEVRIYQICSFRFTSPPSLSSPWHTQALFIFESACIARCRDWKAVLRSEGMNECAHEQCGTYIILCMGG